MPNSSSICAGAPKSRSRSTVLVCVTLIETATSRYWGRLDDNRPWRIRGEECGQVDHQGDSAVVAPLVNRLRGLDQCVSWVDDYGFSGPYGIWLPSRIIASVSLNLSGENRIGQLSLDDDADLSTWVIVNWKHGSRHDRDPTE